ncbi:enterotoxin A family protein [Salmonella enterica]|nr:enterotoxin A family protein [Salmonella enterica]
MKKLILLILMHVTLSCIAAQPKIVYRLDSRGPDEIFANGFRSWGNNLNVFSHITGDSCVNADPEQRNSGFISTAANQQWATGMAMQRVLQFRRQHYYLYRIRADSTFYNAESSLTRYASDNPNVVVSDINFIPSRQSNEYLTPGAIQTTNIMEVTDFYADEFGNIDTTHYQNSNYVSSSTSASSSPYTGSSDSVPRRFTWVRHLPFIGACMSSHDELGQKKNLSSEQDAEAAFTLESFLTSTAEIIDLY